MRERKPYPNISDEELDRRAEETLRRMLANPKGHPALGGHTGGSHAGGSHGGGSHGGGQPQGGGSHHGGQGQGAGQPGNPIQNQGRRRRSRRRR